VVRPGLHPGYVVYCFGRVDNAQRVHQLRALPALRRGLLTGYYPRIGTIPKEPL
jgi:hypothetical protein